MKSSTFELGFRNLFRHTVETDGDKRQVFILFYQISLVKWIVWSPSRLMPIFWRVLFRNQYAVFLKGYMLGERDQNGSTKTHEMSINRLEDNLKKIQVSFVQKVDNGIHWIKLYLVDKAVG